METNGIITDNIDQIILIILFLNLFLFLFTFFGIILHYSIFNVQVIHWGAFGLTPLEEKGREQDYLEGQVKLQYCKPTGHSGAKMTL